jgi:hypothetical protein
VLLHRVLFEHLPTMTSSLHPNSIFHFTSFSGVKGILESSTFLPSYSREVLLGPKTIHRREFGIPLVCFCDIRLADLHKHMFAYGSFGIGLTKVWATNNNISPVTYLSEKGDFLPTYLEAQQDLGQYVLNQPAGHPLVATHHKFFSALDYAKNYESTLYRHNKPPRHNFRFADEREWRYIARIAPLFPAQIAATRINSKKKKSNENKTVSHLGLQFQAQDVTFIVVKGESSISNMIRVIERTNFSDIEKSMLKTRIVSVERLKADA